MTKYEYKTLHISSHKSIDEILNHYGLSGWRLAGVSGTTFILEKVVDEQVSKKIVQTSENELDEANL